VFKMTVDDVLVVRDTTVISGNCINKNDLTEKLIDDAGVEYFASVPFIKYVVSPNLDYITLEIKGVNSPNSLKGSTLRSVVP